MNNWHSLHYNKIAKMIREKRVPKHDPSEPWDVDYAYRSYRNELLDELTLEFVEYFKKDNPLFNEDEFIEACGYKL